MTFANKLDPDKVQQNIAPLLRSYLFDILTVIISKSLDGSIFFGAHFEKKARKKSKGIMFQF